MKKIIYIISCIGALALASCKDYLKENPKTALFGTQIFADATSAKTAVTGCYGFMSTYNCYGIIQTWYLIQPSLFTTYGMDVSTAQNQQTAGYELGLLTFGANNANIAASYSYLYKQISYFNDTIYGIDHSSTLSEDEKNALSAEVHFLRAVIYFDIVRYWGAAPMPLAPPQTLQEAHRPKTPAQDMFSQIINDLRFAFRYMPEKADQMHGRPYRWAALAMLSKVYAVMATSEYYFGSTENEGGEPVNEVDGDPYKGMRAEFWQASYDTADSVYRYGGYSLTPNYSDLFRYRHVATDESIFEIPYNGSVTGQAGWAGRMLVTVSPGYSPLLTSTGGIQAVRPARATYWLHRIRYCISDPTKTTSDPGLQDPRFQETYTPPTIMTYATAPAPAGAVATSTGIYPTDDLNPNVVNIGGNARSTSYMKYCDPGLTGLNTGRCSWVVMRYADLLLTLAEAANEIGKPGEAVARVNEVLARARNSQPYLVPGQIWETYWQRNGAPATEPADWDPASYHPNGAAAPWTKGMLRDSIMMERLFELAGEGSEYSDVRRRGPEYFKKMINICNRFALDTAYGVKADTLTQLTTPLNVAANWGLQWNTALQRWDLLPTANRASDRRIKLPSDEASVKKYLFLPFPTAELTYNQALKPTDQNPGY